MTYSSRMLSPFPHRSSPPPKPRTPYRHLALLLVLVPGLALANPVCGSKWKPGHYVRVPGHHGDSAGKVLNQNLRYFRGIEYQFNWSDVEKGKGVYRFGEIDKVVKQAARKKKYVLLMMMDRTFGGGCRKKFAPSYVKTVAGKSGFCGAAIWERKTNDDRTRVLKKIIKRYRNNRYVVGINLPETAVAVNKRRTKNFSYSKYRKELARAVRELKRAAPEMLVLQGFNWPQHNGFMPGLVSDLLKIDGVGMSWPDTVPARFNSWEHYRLGKKYNRRLVIAPHVQTPFIRPSQTERIFRFLVNDMKAHIIIWNNWHQSKSNYLGKVVIPVVNRHKGKINKSCPS